MNKQHIFKLCLLSVPVLSSCRSEQETAIRPNIVLMIADDVSWDDFGCYGNKDVKTPNTDRLAGSGIRFTNFFLTASSSSPSRNSIITGRYPHNTGASELHTEPPLEMISFPELLKNSGYYTAQAGKFHMGKYAMRGFNVTDDTKLNGDGGEELWVKTLQDRPGDKPFFMWFASFDAHRPWGPNDFSGENDSERIEPPFYLADGQRTKSDLAHYYDEITRFDHYVGLVEKELERQGVLDNTIIIIMADNGRPFPHSKTRVNDRGMKTPFVLLWPDGRGKSQSECASLISAIDIAPTILELASVKIPESMQGQSFKKILKNPDRKFRNFVFAEHNWHDYEAHGRMVRTNDFLYILNSRPQYTNLGPADVLSGLAFIELDSLHRAGIISPVQSEIFMKPRPVEELFDCSADPDQLVNIASDPDFNKIMLRLRKVMSEWMDDTGDNIPDNLTKDWYIKGPGIQKTENFGIRGEPVDQKFNATRNNNKGRF